MLTMGNYLEMLRASYPEEVVTIDEKVNPADFEVTAILKRLELAGKYPIVYFSRPLNLKGEVSEFPIVTNVFATREYCALAMGLTPEQSKLPLALEYGSRESKVLPPVKVPKKEAPVKQVVKVGNEIDLREFPIVRHHDMDLGPYIDMIPIMRDPDKGAYNACFQRTVYKDTHRLGLYMSPRHNWEIVRRNEARGIATPVVVLISHHPAFSLGALNDVSFETDDYGVIGSIMGENLRLTSSETWGEDFLVPADADILVEGEVVPGLREIEAPFGEFTGYFGPQRLSWVIEVKAITHQEKAVYQDIFVSHADNWLLGSVAKEATVYDRIRAFIPGVKAVHMPNSGCGRFNCYISIDKKAPGESKQAALIALGAVHFIKNVIVVDADLDPFNEEEVLWAVATRVQADADIDIIREAPGSNLDPSIKGDVATTKMIIDATMPIDRPFAKRVEVPPEAISRMEPLLKQKGLL
jgi:2,5-furandicarboxylate decarboxylase 1